MVFVTGGTGILGARLLFDLLGEGRQVKALRRPESDMSNLRNILDFYSKGGGEELIDRVNWVEGDIMDIVLLESAMKECSACIHAAAQVSFHPRDQDAMRVTNIVGTSNIVNACLGLNIPVVYVSSVAALGRTSSHQAIDETFVWKDSPYNSGYAISKYRAEMEVWRGIEEGLDAVILNPTIILGAGDDSRSSGTIFGAVMKGLRFYTAGGASVVDVRDVADISLKGLENKSMLGHRYVLNACSLPYKELFNEISDQLGKQRPSVFVGKYALALAWRFLALMDFIFRTKSPLTKESARSSLSSYTYSSAVIEETLDIKLRDWKDSVAYFAEFYSSESS
ncbi:MAG: NAD-dependent epimerase/dehydratase family protein [Flavobacteriales bacterium]|nr:NAD-dependent epimerase/dehydratase family protein [Flavobacteriales bacterium]NNK80460.1 NAD-dependent epimerase/dehydratase family protein [Flavobacteriales bacterium]